MIHRLRRSITGKLFFIICFLLLITILPLFLNVNRTLTQLKDYVLTVNAQQVKTLSDASLSSIALEQAQKCDGILTRVKGSAAFLAQKASAIYGNLDLYSQKPLEIIPLELQPRNRIFYTPRSHPIITAYWGGQKVSPEIEQEIRALSHLGPSLKKAQELNPESIAAHIITGSGIGRYYTIEPTVKDQCYDLPSPEEFDLRNGEPVRIFTRQETGDYHVQLTSPYMDDVIDGFMITATAPVIDASGKFRGIAGIDMPLASILTELIHRPSREKTEGEGIFFKFLMDKNGRFISYPESHLDLFGLEIDTTRFEHSQDILNLNINDVRSPKIKKAFTQILASHSSLTRLSINQDDYIFTAHTLSEAGWHLVLVSREKDLLASVYQTQKAVEKSMSQISDYYTNHSMLIVFIAVLLVFGTVKLIIQPIKRLTLLAQSISDGDLSQVSQIDRKDEIGVLADAIDQMTQKLILLKENEKQHASSLEKTIADRTKELHVSNLDLIRAKEELEAIVAKRTSQLKLLNEHLIYSEGIERKAIAADLHDTIAQTLALSISKIKTMNEPGSTVNFDVLLEIQSFLEQTAQGIRSLIYQLSPPILDDFDIDIALGFLIEENNTQHNAQLTYINKLEDPVDLKKALKLMLYRATAELITNLFKYAGTKKAEIEISSTDTHISIRVEDKGVGMNVEKITAAQGYGFGLYYISQRVENFGGRFIIESKPGQGTKIIIITPMVKEAWTNGKNQTYPC